ncbi:MAG: hypothetical protein DYG94_04555 [Leptolyngbya sp. PLA3]|nr:MAG: hypothetical protein EDM82_07340 [Cyanobacteria bacterium CYA]MCE7968002.1 hypothetical protein [Leptolyngbya sp. PL-A3]
MRTLCLILAAVIGGQTSRAEVTLEFRPESEVVSVGQIARVGLFATWNGQGYGQTISAVELVFAWDQPRLHLLGLDHAGGAPFLTSGFPSVNSGGLNETSPPGDGDGMYRALAMLGAPIDATEGVRLTTFVFHAWSPAAAASVCMLARAGNPMVHTSVFDGAVPNADATGALIGTSIRIVPAPGAGWCLLLPGLMRMGRPRRRM